MAEDDNGDKTEAPTPRRRQEARDQGNIARSPDLTSSVLLVGSLMLLKWYGMGLIIVLQHIVAALLSPSSFTDVRGDHLGQQIIATTGSVGLAIAPLLGGAALIVILANLAQVGLFFNMERLTPNFAALNPMNGLQKILGRGKGVMHLAMNSVKMALVGFVAYGAVSSRLGQIVAIQEHSFLQIFQIGGGIVFAIGIRIGVLLLVLALLDYVWQRYQMEQQLKMSKQEIKDEMRNMEGDPVIKRRRRQIAMQRALQRLKKDVPTADVIVTNPTHFAVALKYDDGKMGAPRVIAKGADLIAQRIREIAAEAGIPIVERAPLARAIYRMVNVGQEIPEEFYSAVAEILAYVYQLKGQFRSKAVA